MPSCHCCGREFQTERGLSTHVGMQHRQGSPQGSGASPPKRARREAGPPPPCPAFVPGVWGDAPDLGFDTGEEAEDAEDAAVLQQIREKARHLLTQPSWRQWAVDMLAWAEGEEGILSHLHHLYPEAGDFESRETFRFLQLRSMHPGSAFAKELLAAAQEEQLDLQKVCPPTHPHFSSLIHGICQAYACRFQP